MTTFDTELPTRPDLPANVARRCIWCCRAYGDHLKARPASAPVPRMPCLGLRSGFTPERNGAADGER